MPWVFFREQNPICHGNKNKKLRNSRYVISTFPQEGNYIMEKFFVYNILMSNSMIPNDDVQLMLEKNKASNANEQQIACQKHINLVHPSP